MRRMKCRFTNSSRFSLSQVLPYRIVRAAGYLAIVLLVSVTFLRPNFLLPSQSVLAWMPHSKVNQDYTLAPSSRIQPTGVSVINFAELAERDARASTELKPNAALAFRVDRPPKTIPEVDSGLAGQPTST